MFEKDILYTEKQELIKAFERDWNQLKDSLADTEVSGEQKSIAYLEIVKKHTAKVRALDKTEESKRIMVKYFADSYNVAVGKGEIDNLFRRDVLRLCWHDMDGTCYLDGNLQFVFQTDDHFGTTRDGFINVFLEKVDKYAPNGMRLSFNDASFEIDVLKSFYQHNVSVRTEKLSLFNDLTVGNRGKIGHYVFKEDDKKLLCHCIDLSLDNIELESEFHALTFRDIWVRHSSWYNKDQIQTDRLYISEVTPIQQAALMSSVVPLYALDITRCSDAMNIPRELFDRLHRITIELEGGRRNYQDY